MKRTILLTTMLICLVLISTACDDIDISALKDQIGIDIELVDVEPIDKNKIFVSAEWLNSVIEGKQPQSKNYVILEGSWGEASEEYKNTHIPGAIHINTDLIEEETYWNIRTPEEIEQVLKDFGITKDTVLITYGGPAGRVAFVGFWAGVEEVHILDGGLDAWLEGNYPTESGIVEPVAVADFGTKIPARPEYLVSMPEEVIEFQKDNNFRLVSIRSWEQFIGETSGYNYIDRVGEPLGAVWGHSSKAYCQADGTIKPIDEIQETLWDEWDIKESNKVSFYCGTGWGATIPFFVAYENGWRDITLYDGGWFVWQMDENLPIQIGDPR